MMFKEYLLSTASEIEQALKRELASWQETVGEKQPQLSPLIAAFADQCQGGKRIRGTLVCLGYELAGGMRENKDILLPAVAFEIFQTAILAHDDIIDKSTLRRGKPSLYQALGGDHYGISQTISLGDLGFFHATELIAGSAFPDERKNKAVVFFSKILQETALGELFDVFLPTKKTFTDADVISIARLKTAAYSLIGPLSLGATLAGADEKLLEKIQEFGEKLGIAYQLQDDILGIYGEAETLGKSNTSDIAEGKATLLLWYAREHGDTQSLDLIYGKQSVTEAEAGEIRKVFDETGARTYATEQVNAYTQKARMMIEHLTDDMTTRKLFQDMTDFLLERKK